MYHVEIITRHQLDIHNLPAAVWVRLPRDVTCRAFIENGTWGGLRGNWVGKYRENWQKSGEGERCGDHLACVGKEVKKN